MLLQIHSHRVHGVLCRSLIKSCRRRPCSSDLDFMPMLPTERLNEERWKGDIGVKGHTSFEEGSNNKGIVKVFILRSWLQ